jgi:hypothetical protein
MRFFQPLYAADKFRLHIFRKRAGKSVQVCLVGVKPFEFNKDMMP